MKFHDTKFWNNLDKLLLSSEIIIDRPKGSTHPRYPKFKYPADYGFLKNTKSMDGGGIDIWVGTNKVKMIDAVICTLDLFKRDAEIKILFGCSRHETNEIFKSMNMKKMGAMIIFR